MAQALLVLPAAARALVLATFACTAVLLGWSVTGLRLSSDVSATAGFLVLAAVGTAALSGSLREGRNSSSRFTSTDSCWTVAAAVLLPLPVVAPVALLIRYLVTRVLIGRQHGFRFVFSLCVAALSAGAAGAVGQAALPVPLDELTRGDGLRTAVGLAAVCGAHLLVDRLVVLAIWLGEPARTRRDLRWSPAMDDVEVCLLFLGAMLAPLLAVHLALGLLAVPVPVVLHRLTGAGLLWQAADRDAKTGLLNAVAWTSAAARTLARATAAGRGVAVVVVDLDHFKLVNDQRGHLVGDAVLLRTAETLRSGLRPDSLLARFGGEEFVVFLPDADEDAARRTAERLRTAVEHQAVEGDPELRVTASFGVACGTGAGLTELLEQADRALYVAKRTGRNRVEVVTVREPAAGVADSV